MGSIPRPQHFNRNMKLHATNNLYTRNHYEHTPPAIMTTSRKVSSKQNSTCFLLNHFPRVAILYYHGGSVYPTVTLAYGTLDTTIGALEAGAFGHGSALRSSWGTWVRKWTSGNGRSVQHGLNCNN